MLISCIASFLGGAAPVPGGMGVIETGLIAGLTASGIPEAQAVAATFTARMCTSYLPPICGWFALSWLRKKEYVYAVTDDKGGRAAWHGREYAPQAEHHRVLDEPFIARHPPASDAVVVDVGCGTGEFTVQLAELVPAGRVIGVDPDPSMLEQAQTKARANLEFRVGRVQQLDEVCEVASADLVVSRAMFHWIPLNEYARCYNAIFRVLKPSGWFHAESGGAGNVRAVIALLSDVAVEQGLTPARITFPDAGSVLDILEQAGFQIGDGGVTTVAQRRRFDRDQLIGFVRTQPSLAYVVGAPPEVRDAFLAAVERRVDELRRYDGTYDQTFVRLHVLGQRQ